MKQGIERRIAYGMNILAAVALGVAVSSCSVLSSSSPMQQHVVACAGKTRSEVLNDFAGILAAEGFKMRVINERAGILEAERVDGSEAVSWQILYRGDTVFAIPVRSYQSANSGTSVVRELTANGSQTQVRTNNSSTVRSPGDDTDDDVRWYWNIRKELERYCGARAVVREIQR